MKTWQEIVTERIQGYKVEQVALVEEIHAKISRNDALDVVIRELELVLAGDGREFGSEEVGRKLKGVAQRYTPAGVAKIVVSRTVEQQVADAEAMLEVHGPCTYNQLRSLSKLSILQLSSVFNTSQRITKSKGLYQLKGA